MDRNSRLRAGWTAAVLFVCVWNGRVVDAQAAPVEEFFCESIAGVAVVGWVNQGPYGSIRVYLDGELQSELSGTQEMYTEFGLSGGTQQLCIEPVDLAGVALVQTCCDVYSTPPPENLVCAALDATTAHLTWDNPADYSVIMPLVDGIPYPTYLTSSPDTEVTITGLSPEPHTICLLALPTGSIIPHYVVACCTFVSPGGPTILSGGACEPVPGTTQVDVSWENDHFSATIAAVIDGVLVQTAPGTISSFTTAPLGPGAHTICVQSIDGMGTVVEERCCDVTFDAAPQPSVSCVTLPGTTRMSASWVSDPSYDWIDVSIDGVLAATLPGTVTTYLSSELGGGAHELCIEAYTWEDISIGVDCCELSVVGTGPGLTCETVTGTTAVELEWLPIALFDSIQICVDDFVIATLAGGATSYTTPPLGSGSHSVCIKGLGASAVVLAEACCTTGEPVVELDITCAPVAGSRITVTWLPHPSYDTIEIRVDGVAISTEPGSTSSFTTPQLAPGPHLVCVIAIDATGAALDQDCCGGAVPLPGGPGNLSCATLDGFPAAFLTWSNPGVYDSVGIYVDGVEWLTIDGSLETIAIQNLTAGEHTICLEARGPSGFVFGVACCDVTIVDTAVGLFIRGDCDQDLGLDSDDVAWILQSLLPSGDQLACADACDVNDDGKVDIRDAMDLVRGLFTDNSAPPAPFPGCGVDPTVDRLDCETPSTCP